MDVKADAPLEILRDILKERNGMLLTSDLAKHDIPRTYLSILEKNGEIVRLSRGIYSATDTLADEMFAFQAQYQRAVFSHETALFLHDMTDRTPLRYTVTVPSGYKATAIREKGHKVFYASSRVYDLGLISGQSPHMNPLKTYDLERTICDLLRSRSRIDIQLITDAIKQYVSLESRNIDLLITYANQLNIQSIVRRYVEILL